MDRAYLSLPSNQVAALSDAEFLGRLTAKLPFAIEPTQRAAWEYQARHLRALATQLPDAYFAFEFLIPRMERRADLIIICEGIIFVVEYKLGATGFDRSSIEQAYGYGLDLKHFHEPSHHLPIVPVLVATAAGSGGDQSVKWDSDGLAKTICVTPEGTSAAINHICRVWGGGSFDPIQWLNGRYKPTPTIVEAAQALYRGHDVEEISRSEAGVNRPGFAGGSNS